MKDAEWIRARAVQALRADQRLGSTADAKARVSSRLAGSIAALGGPVSGVAHVSAAKGAASSSLLSQAGQLVAPTLARTLIVTATAFAAGGAVGAGVHARISAPAEKVVYVEHAPTPTSAPIQASSPTATQAATAPMPTPNSSIEPRVETPNPVARERPQPTAQTDAREAPKQASLAEQRALLDDARSALARGKNDSVLQTLSEHEQRFPKSALDEEREALAIKALVGAGRRAEARARAAEFKRRFPESLLWPSVSDAVERIP